MKICKQEIHESMQASNVCNLESYVYESKQHMQETSNNVMHLLTYGNAPMSYVYKSIKCLMCTLRLMCIHASYALCVCMQAMPYAYAYAYGYGYALLMAYVYACKLCFMCMNASYG